MGPTRVKILYSLLSQGKTARQVADELGIQASAGRKHLERMKAQGLVEDTMKQVGMGRPKKFYALKEKAKELFPREYDTILSMLIEKLVQGGEEGRVESLMNQIAHEIASKTEASGADPLERLLAVSNRLGFVAELEAEGDSKAIISHNCLIRSVAFKHRELVCRGIHAELIKIVSGFPNVKREEWMVDGDPYCKHVLDRDGIRGN